MCYGRSVCKSLTRGELPARTGIQFAYAANLCYTVW